MQMMATKSQMAALGNFTFIQPLINHSFIHLPDNVLMFSLVFIFSSVMSSVFSGQSDEAVELATVFVE